MSITISGSGAITGASTSYSFDQAVSIAGTVTYEDVTSVDSVGIITAQSGIHVTGGSIGIGTLSPSGPVHANTASGTQRSYLEASASHSFLRLKAGSTSFNSGLEFFSGASNIANVNGLGAGGLQFEVNGSERLRINSDGDVCIGINTNFGTENENLNVASGGGGRIALLRNDTSISSGNELGRITWYSNDSTSTTYQQCAAIRALAAGAFGDGDKPTDLTFSTTPDNTSTPAERLRITSGGNIGINSTDPTSYANSQATLVIEDTISPALCISDTGQARDWFLIGQGDGLAINYADGGGSGSSSNVTGAMFLRNNGNIGINESTPGAKLHIVDTMQATANGHNQLLILGDDSGTDGESASIYMSAINATNRGCKIVSERQSSSNNHHLIFQTSSAGAIPSERMRIDSSGNVLFGTTTNGTTEKGIVLRATGELLNSRVGGPPLLVNRLNDDGSLVDFRGQNSSEGSITVSGSTVSYNGGHLTRWSQLAGNAERIEILRGSVLSNLDEMCEWGEEDNEQLNRMKVSDVEGDANVSGVFQCWDDDDDTYTNDFYCAVTGDFVIRIAQGVTVARGDLLMSAGDGTAKPQGDDIVRSKTVAKVTSTTVSVTYTDGSYCVPCVLMAC